MSRPSTSIVVCTYTQQRWDDIVEAVQSLEEQTTPPDEIILVADHNDALLSRLRDRFDHPVVANTQARGLSGARNCGVAAAASDLVGFLDDDAVAHRDWLERLLEACTDPDVLGAGGAVRPLWLSGRARWFPDEFLWVIGCSYRGLPESTATVRNVFGGCMLMRRRILLEVGGFDTRVGRLGEIPVGDEETAMCIRANAANPGRHFVYVPAALIDHKIPASRARLGYFLARCRAEGVSKARTAGIVGSSDALSTERSYATRVLPRGVLRGLTQTLALDPYGVVRSLVILLGLAATTYGYVRGRLSKEAG